MYSETYQSTIMFPVSIMMSSGNEATKNKVHWWGSRGLDIYILKLHIKCPVNWCTDEDFAQDWKFWLDIMKKQPLQWHENL